MNQENNLEKTEESIVIGEQNSSQSESTNKINPELKEMSLTAHLEELRQAIIISIFSLVITSGLCFYFNRQLFDLLTAPLTQNVKNVELIFVSPGEAFSATLRSSLITGLILAMPVILNRIFWFISPGLTKSEKAMSLPIVIVAYLLFLAGAFFSYFALLPFGVKFLVEFAPQNIHPMISIGSYISFSSTLILGTGLIFELPLILLFLGFLGIINSTKLIKFRKYAVLTSFIIGAIVTPSVDMVTQSLLAGALYLLYEMSIILVRALDFRRAKKSI